MRNAACRSLKAKLRQCALQLFMLAEFTERFVIKECDFQLPYTSRKELQLCSEKKYPYSLIYINLLFIILLLNKFLY